MKCFFESVCGGGMKTALSGAVGIVSIEIFRPEKF
jgi:hypothetical protein